MTRNKTHSEPLDLKLTLVRPIKVELSEKAKDKSGKKRRKKYFWVLTIGFSIILIIFFLLYSIFVLQKEHPVLNCDPLFLSSLISFPTYISSGDEYQIELTLINETNKIMNGIKAIIIYSGDNTITTPIGQSTAVEFENLNSGERKSRDIKILLKNPIKEKEMRFSVKLLNSEGKEKELEKSYIVKVCWFNKIRLWLKVIMFFLVIPAILYFAKDQLIPIIANILKNI